MKKVFRGMFAALILISSVASTLAQTSVDPMKLPKLTQWVTDFSSSLSLNQTDELNTIARDYETQTSNQLVTVLFPHRQGNELIDIGMKVFTDNAIGQAKKNNGLLLLISTQEKKIRIVVGYGLEGVYPDAIANRIIEENIRPLVNAGDFYGAIKAFYSKSAEVIGGEFTMDTWTSSAQAYFNKDGVYVLFMRFIFWTTGGRWIDYLKKKKHLPRS
ncbi:MAG: TPM domain-containing protein [bacterium]